MTFRHTIRNAEQLEGVTIRLLRGYVKENGVPPTGLEVTLAPPKRTNPQNKYYWRVVTPMVADWLEEKVYPGTIWTKEMAHDVLKGKFLPMEEYPNGKSYPKSTTKLTTQEFSDYLMEIQAYCAGYGLIIPDPNEEV